MTLELLVGKEHATLCSDQLNIIWSCSGAYPLYGIQNQSPEAPDPPQIARRHRRRKSDDLTSSSFC